MDTNQRLRCSVVVRIARLFSKSRQRLTPSPRGLPETDWGLGKDKAATALAKVCRQCKGTYSPSDNTTLSCRFHPSFFVCRRHDDQKRYYELRDDDPPYAAKFYDRCGAEDPGAPGCKTDFHVSYDDADQD